MLNFTGHRHELEFSRIDVILIFCKLAAEQRTSGDLSKKTFGPGEPEGER